MRLCKKCKIPKEDKDFRKISRRIDGLDLYCKICRRESDKKTYNKHIESNRATIVIYKRKVRENNARYIINYLQNNHCLDCGESDILVLDFDHRSNKYKSICDLARNHSIEKIKEEIDKCDVRCANCHRRKTLKENNSFKYRHCQMLKLADRPPILGGAELPN